MKSAKSFELIPNACTINNLDLSKSKLKKLKFFDPKIDFEKRSQITNKISDVSAAKSNVYRVEMSSSKVILGQLSYKRGMDSFVD